MSAGIYALYVEAGTTFSRVFTWQTGTPPVTVNLTGWSAHAQIRDAVGDLLVDLTVGNGGVALGGSAGTITMAMTPTQTLQLAAYSSADPPQWDLKLTDTSGNVTRLLQGKVTVSAQVTT